MRLAIRRSSVMRAGAILLAAFLFALPLHAAKADVENDMQPGVDFPGGDIQRFLLQPDPGLCRQACDQNGQCRAWTFVKPGVFDQSAVCFLKNAIGNGAANQNTISGVKPNGGGPAPGNARTDFSMMFGVDLGGADLQSFQIPRGDPALCQAACDQNNQCQSWTMTKPGFHGPAAVCFLKRAVPQPKFAQSVISGTRNGPRTPGGPPGGGAGPGGVTGTSVPALGAGKPVVGMSGGAPSDWGVWASAAGGRWNDPCAILYNAAQLANNRYDPSAGYVRVRTRTNQRDADLDIDQFGLHHRDMPDGIVKLVSCRPKGPTDDGPKPPHVVPGITANAAQWMTGNFTSSYGKMTLSPGGGSYDYQGGTLAVSKITGNVMEGTWRQTNKITCNGREVAAYGKFKFTFSESGFDGSWGNCDAEPNRGGWYGTKVK